MAEEQPVPIAYVGMRDRYGTSGTSEELLEYFGLTPAAIAEAARKVIGRKRELSREYRCSAALEFRGLSGLRRRLATEDEFEHVPGVAADPAYLDFLRLWWQLLDRRRGRIGGLQLQQLAVDPAGGSVRR